MRKHILALLFVGVLPTTHCGPGGQTFLADRDSRSAQLTITTKTLPPGFVGSGYLAHLTASGGVEPYHWSMLGGELPQGLELDGKTGEFRGTPTEYGNESLLLRVSDATLEKNQESTATLQLEITPDRLTILTEALPQATGGQPYTFKLEAAGGAEPYRWSIKEGALPAGLEFDTESGVIQGSPTQPGTSIMVVEVTDSSTPAVSVACRFSP